MTRRLPPALLALTPGTCASGAGGHSLLTSVARALEGGLQGVLLREPNLGDTEFTRLGCQLRDLLGERWLGVHDRAHLVAAVRADGLHLGFRSLPALEARRVVGDVVTIGVSDHAGDASTDLSAADYRTYGPLHATPSKVGLLEPVGMDGLQAACAAHAIPTWALGGVNPEDAARVGGVGAHGVAVLSGVLGADDPTSRARAFLQSLADPA